MFRLDFVSARGGVLPLVGNEYFALMDATGMTLSNSSISASTIPTMDGSNVNNVQTRPRPIVLYFEIRQGKNVEEAKRVILTYIKPKLPGKLKWEQNGREIEIEGIVENVDMPRFTNKVVMQVSMYCANPYWEDIEYIIREISQYDNLHYFPIASGGLYFPVEGIPFGVYDIKRTKLYTNAGDVATGMIITIMAVGTATNPVLYNVDDNTYIGIDTTLVAGDEVVISTVKGKKYIRKNGANIIDKIKEGSTWLQLNPGENTFMIDSDDESIDNMTFTLTYKHKYV